MDDQGRVIACFAAEAEFEPVARVETVATLARGILRARIPGSEAPYGTGPAGGTSTGGHGSYILP